MEGAVGRFLTEFELVFHADWEMSRGCLLEANYIHPNGTFLEPMVDDESNNWANRGALLEDWRELRRAMKRLQVGWDDRLGPTGSQ